MTRTNLKHVRLYGNGTDLSGYARDTGPFGVEFDVSPEAALSDAVLNVTMGRGAVTLGPVNAFLDNDTAGLYALVATPPSYMDVLVAIGALASPAAGDFCFAWQFGVKSIKAGASSGTVPLTMELTDGLYSSPLAYNKPWGRLLHASGAETAVNTSTGIDDNGASSSLGGVFVYHLLSSNGTVTLKAQHAASNVDGSFADLTGATSGSIDASSTPKSGLVSLSATASVNRYLRWQLSFGTATTATFVTAFIRG